MELRQLRYFLKIAEEGSFTRAAKVLCVSQSALSLSIKELESAIDAAVFDRGPSGVTLTDLGRTLKGYAYSMLQQHDKALEEIAILRGREDASISIGLHSAFPRRNFDLTLREFFRTQPNVRLNMSSGAHPFDHVVNNVRRNVWDMGVTLVPSEPGLKLDDVDLGSRKLAESKSCVFASPDHPLISCNDVGMEQMLEFSWAVSATGFANNNFQRLFTEVHSTIPRVGLISDSFSDLLRTVLGTHLLCFAPNELVETLGIPLVPIEQRLIAPIHTAWILVFSRNLQTTSSASILLGMLNEDISRPNGA